MVGCGHLSFDRARLAVDLATAYGLHRPEKDPQQYGYGDVWPAAVELFAHPSSPAGLSASSAAITGRLVGLESADLVLAYYSGWSRQSPKLLCPTVVRSPRE
jgi:hypothetical protein